MRPSFRNKRVLITAGPTREGWDPVRYLTNASSGRMGIAMAEALRRRGARVTLLLGPTQTVPPRGVHLQRVRSAEEMHQAVMKRIRRVDAFIAAAAVSDWRFKKVWLQKFKKGARRQTSVVLVRTPDILAEVGRLKRIGRFTGFSIGFSLETGRIAAASLKKAREKKCDLIIGNSPASFSGSSIRPFWVEAGSSVVALPKMTKSELSEKVVEWLKEKWRGHDER